MVLLFVSGLLTGVFFFVEKGDLNMAETVVNSDRSAIPTTNFLRAGEFVCLIFSMLFMVFIVLDSDKTDQLGNLNYDDRLLVNDRNRKYC